MWVYAISTGTGPERPGGFILIRSCISSHIRAHLLNKRALISLVSSPCVATETSFTLYYLVMA